MFKEQEEKHTGLSKVDKDHSKNFQVPLVGWTYHYHYKEQRKRRGSDGVQGGFSGRNTLPCVVFSILQANRNGKQAWEIIFLTVLCTGGKEKRWDLNWK